MRAALIAFGIGVSGFVASPFVRANDATLGARLPAEFVENRGQWKVPARFVARSGALAAAIEDGAIALHLRAEGARAGAEPVRLVFEGASPGVRPSGDGARGGRYSFYLGNDPARWRSAVPGWQRVRWRELYAGIDVVVREEAGRLEYDLELRPAADLSAVQVRCEGASRIEIASDGALVLHTAAGPLRQTPPRSFELLESGERRPVPSRFRILDAKRFGFEAPERDPALALVVDPGLEWSTFLGGGDRDQITAVAVATDGTDDVIVAGHTWSTDFPATGGERGASPLVPFVARFDSTGTTLLYATLFGGTSGNVSYVHDLALDASSAPIVAGETNAADYPTTPGAYQTSFNEPPVSMNRGWDATVTRFDAAGSRLVFSTFLGAAPILDETRPGSKRGGDEAARAVVVDAAGEVIVAGRTSSENFPTTPGAYDRTLDTIQVQVSVGANTGTVESRTDAFVARFDATGSRLLYSTYLGGQADDFVSGMVVDEHGFVTLAGVAAPIETFDAQNNRVQHGTPFPTTPDAIARTHLGASDIFVARMRLDGAGTADLRYATLFGGFYVDDALDVALDPLDPERVVVCGTTRSFDFPTTAGAWKRAPIFMSTGTPYYAGVLAQFRFPATGGGGLGWSTLVEGTAGAQIVQSAAVDRSGDVKVVITDEGGLESTERSWKRLPAQGLFVARFSGDGRELRYGTFLHRQSFLFSDSLRIACAGPNSVVVSGLTVHPTFPTTPGAFDRLFGSDGTSDFFHRSDGFVAKLTLEPVDAGDSAAEPPALLSPADGATFASGSTITFDWTDVADPSGVQGYEVIIAPNPEFLPGFGTRRRAAVADSTWSLTLVTDEVLYWRVRTLDGANNFSAWSESRRLTVGAATWTNFCAATLSPNAVAGGSSVLGKVYVQNQAPAGGKVYTLTSSNPAIASVPPSTTVPAGSNVASFVVTTSPVAASTPVQITVWTEGNGDHPVLWVDPAPAGVVLLSSLAISPTSVVGPDPAQGTVRLSASAPEGGATVTLASGNPAVAGVPPSVTVPAGLSAASFPITTAQVEAATSVAIGASYGDSTRTAALEVTPPPVPAAPSLVSPSDGARLPQPIMLDWTDVAGAVAYQIHIDDSSSFSTPLVVDARVTESRYVACGLSQRRHWWRVRGVNSAGVPGPWSSSRRVEPTSACSGEASLVSISLSPQSVPGGTVSQGTVTLSAAAPTGSAVVALSSSDPATASVPASVTVPAGSTSATFSASTAEVTSSRSVVISAAYAGVTRTASLTVNLPSSDSVSIQLAEYDGGGRRLRVEAASTGASATLRVFLSSTDQLIGTLADSGGGRHRGEFSWPANPQNVTVRSSLGGSASREVTLK